MRKLTILTILVLAALTTAVTDAGSANAVNKAVLTVPLIWSADGTGGRNLSDNVSMTNAQASSDGSVKTGSQEGSCSLKLPYKTAGLIYKVSASWTFIGSVTMELSATGETEDYKPVTNGVPLNYGDFIQGTNIRWRATLGPDSSLSDVKIIYSDLSGVAGTFGNPDLNGFTARKLVFIKGSSQGTLYNYQVPIKVGESGSVPSCDVYMEAPSRSDMADVRFTLADGETSLAYWRESPQGSKPERSALFWVNLPQMPKTGLPIYIYYGRQDARDLSNGPKVFDFFDDFASGGPDSKVWKIYYEDEKSRVSVAGSMVEIEKARIIADNYKFTNGVIEYRAKLIGNGGVTGIIIAAGTTPENDINAYSSIIAASAHCITQGDNVRTNDPKQIELGTFYNFRVTCEGSGIIFQRYPDGWSQAAEAMVKCPLDSAKQAAPIGLSAGTGGGGLYCDWIRTRKIADPAPYVDAGKTGKEESTNLPVFNNVIVDKNGSLALYENAAAGEYISALILAPFEARILSASWKEHEADRGPAKVGVSTKENGNFISVSRNGVVLYASKEEFQKGSQLRWKAALRRGSTVAPSPYLDEFSLAFYPGTIKVLMPAGGNAIAPGSRYSIIWDASGYEPSYGMNLYYSKDNGTSFTPIVTNYSNGSAYTWSVPGEEAEKAVIMVADHMDKSVFGISGLFTISKSAGETNISEEEEEAAKAAADKERELEAKKQREAEARAKKETPGTAGGVKLYELLIKTGAPSAVAGGVEKASPGTYQNGDIVAIKPAGFSWGSSERMNFKIVRAYLTQAEIEELTSPQETAGGTAKKLIKIRKHGIDLKKKDAIRDKVTMVKGVSQDVPLINKKAIVDKSVSQ